MATGDYSGLNAALGGTPYTGEYAYAYTFSQYADSIMSDGLRPYSFATTDGTMSPLQAQIDMALLPNRGLPDSIVRINVRAMIEDGMPPPTMYTGINRIIGVPEMQFGEGGVPPAYLMYFRNTGVMYRGGFGLPGESELLPGELLPPVAGGVVIF